MASRKRQWKDNIQQAKQRAAISSGDHPQGFIVIPSHPGRWRNALWEVLDLIKTILQTVAPNADHQNISFEDQLQSELASTDVSEWKFFEVCKNVCFLKYPINEQVKPPSQLIQDVFEVIITNPERCPKNVTRILPVDFMIPCSMSALTAVMEDHLPHIFPKLQKKTERNVCAVCSTEPEADDSESWALRFEGRIASRLKREEVITVVGDLMVPKDSYESDGERPRVYPVNLSAESRTILVESNPLFVGVAICRNFNKLKRFNPERACGLVVAEQSVGGDANQLPQVNA
eukprot:Protomagalhaensia_sp_Gyna_25__2674@NODE_2529_length_1033_cov_64_456740_g2097_i0_p1_GENE_NODE_2529_length_1033_cov_64_456740_g2097_i0NODE_2529_length_1033_cov_64_456740_g2097_i0_p1_ORF_typecomplete_len289_score27_49LapD_MoxY_N/PF16448_5/0_4LapD_MoxY_N/PF16448_5/1_7e03_NODE_2529_length_1033_cov_64_456740_g2097_i063929